ncbi:MAG TPA: protein kinase [Bryobacteraceae bacterium]|nr:protein kinase [Bryobacteraceae bacterium]
MTPSRWARVKSIFLRARDASAPERVLQDASSSTAREAGRLLAFAEGGSQTGIQLPDSSEMGGAAFTARPFFEAGAGVAGRFQIVKLLGRGGMGEVYEALDTVKKQAVALKVLRPDNPGVDPEMSERLLRKEVSLAQRVSHRNICRINDPYRHELAGGGTILLLSMELLRGRTLAEFCGARGRLVPEEALPLARQIAAGIDAAHAADIVHRDLKPSNVMLVEEPSGTRVVITDFGLARSQSDGQSASTFTQGVAGTLRYMAPEQLEGRADGRSDLYTFCLLLFELVTGEQPFTGATDMSLALSRLKMPPRDPGEFVPGLSLAWRRTLLRGLDRNPSHRFTSGREIVASLESRTRAWLVLPQIVLTQTLRRLPWLRWALPVLLLALGSVSVYLTRPPPAAFPPFSRLLFAGLEHAASGDRALLGAGISLSSAIGQSPHLAVSRPDDLAGTLQRMGKRPAGPLDRESLRQLALRTGQGAVLTGSISKGRGYALRLRMEALAGDPRYAGAVSARDFEARDEKELFSAIASASQWVRKLSGEGVRDLNEQAARPEDLSTGSWQALNLLQQAHDRRNANDAQGALVFAREALDIDPEFAAAESLRGDVLTQLGQYRTGFAAHRRAVELARRRNITGRERYQIEAILDEDIGDYDSLPVVCKAWIAHFPNDSLPHLYLATVFRIRGDPQSAVAQLQMAGQLDPSAYTVYPHLAECYLGIGRPEQARQCAITLRQLGEPDWAREVEGQILLWQRQFDQALAKIRPLLERKDDVFSSVAPVYVANALADTGRLLEAESVLAEAAHADSERGLSSRRAERQVSIAYLRYLQDDERGARLALTAFVADLDNPESLSLAGALLARTGDLTAARRVLTLLGRWPDVPVADVARARLRAEIALARHLPAAANLAEVAAPHSDSPLEMDFLLHAAKMLGRVEEVDLVRRRIANMPQMLIGWGDWRVPGLFWSASCVPPGPAQASGRARRCPGAVNATLK